MSYLEAGKKAIKTLKENGFEAYFVGGFVRDYLLGIEANDIDIATNALPNDIINLFEVITTGIKYNSIKIICDGYEFETTTYRLESQYLDNRHPTYSVANSISDDLKRRDFTINAMAMDENFNIVDLFGGKDDLEHKLIKTVFEPQKRFSEDSLRMLRAAYFASKLGFEIEKETLNSMKRCSYLVQNLSVDRVSWELEKIINSYNPLIGLNYLIEANIAPYLYNFKNAIFIYSKKLITSNSWPLFVAISYYDDIDALNYLHLKGNLAKTIITAINLAKECKKNNFTKLHLFEYGVLVVQLANDINKYIHNSKDYLNIESDYNNLPIHKLSDLAIKGQDIIDNINLKDNRMINTIIQKVKELVINEKLENDKDLIIKYIKKHY